MGFVQADWLPDQLILRSASAWFEPVAPTGHHRWKERKMSVFSGSQGKGAARRHRDEKRAEAEERNRRSNAKLRDCGHVHGDTIMCRDVAS